ncbi:MAG TPA: bifunctional 2-C-methyl-D-erythritol 4-phosphate cytidylyltransferase/2-C-methyl-D-erythritol 2,4-cyclodiphosphate synthase [Devosia sp.]|nr:bifunctional 2-C-methyl-D-erythritol 4-phosphate cytidylyltransferase/2-C-methyl-D-erythritol 2,4-cyclodiphosphate synthase [Devosia sp.]
MNENPSIAVIVVAAGTGTRAERHTGELPKQYRALGGKAVLAHAVEAFFMEEDVNWVLPVINPDHGELFDALGLEDTKLLAPVHGGKERQASCLAGLEALETLAPDLVLLHDAARPIVASETIAAIKQALQSHHGALPVLPVTDTIKRSFDGARIEATEDRNQLWAAQTPQGFRFARILSAHRKAAKQQSEFTDDAAIAEWAGLDVVLVPGHENTFKITLPQDFVRAEMMIGQMKNYETRVGSGLDIHQFESGDNVRLGGVDFPHDAKLKGHSDADAALHVLTDALLGALAEGDIGTHFPPGDKKWKNASSDVFLSFAAERVLARGGRISHLDLTIVCEAPKIGPKSTKIRQIVAKICKISENRVSVKATTSEKMGFIGREEGLMTMATATIELPREDD